MKSVSDRLRDALAGGPEPLSLRELHRRLQEEDRFNGSYSTLHRYFSGETEPPTSFLVEVAEVMACRPEWLLTGRGERTETKQRLREWMRHTRKQQSTDAAKDQGPRPGFKYSGTDDEMAAVEAFWDSIDDYPDLPWPARIVLFQYLLRIMEKEGDPGTTAQRAGERLLKIVGEPPGQVVGGSEDATVAYVYARVAAAWLEDFT